MGHFLLDPRTVWGEERVASRRSMPRWDPSPTGPAQRPAYKPAARSQLRLPCNCSDATVEDDTSDSLAAGLVGVEDNAAAETEKEEGRGAVEGSIVAVLGSGSGTRAIRLGIAEEISADEEGALLRRLGVLPEESSREEGGCRCWRFRRSSWGWSRRRRSSAGDVCSWLLFCLLCNEGKKR